jgi:hypothetical protein
MFNQDVDLMSRKDSRDVSFKQAPMHLNEALGPPGMGLRERHEELRLERAAFTLRFFREP